MTRPLRHSPEAIEKPFNAWIRNCRELDSVRHGISVHNSDLWVHRYKVDTDRIGTRELNHLMLVEVKTHGATMRMSQKDTLLIIDQCLRLADKILGAGRFVLGLHPQLRKLLPRRLRAWGVFFLRMSHTSPLNSTWMEWRSWEQRHPITLTQLIDVLRFERDPNTLRPRSDRRHHKLGETPLFPEDDD